MHEPRDGSIARSPANQSSRGTDEMTAHIASKASAALSSRRAATSRSTMFGKHGVSKCSNYNDVI